MVPGAATDATDEIVVGRPEDVADPRRRYAEEGERREEPRYEPRDEAREEAEAGAADVPGDAGTLRLDVHPSDASIYVDGSFRGTARMRSLRLSPGRHRIEVVRPGYRTMEREVDVEPGREVELRFELDRS